MAASETRTASTRRLRVIVGEDDVLLREGIVRILAAAGLDVVAQSGDADDLLLRALAHRPDVAIVDVRMPPRREDDGLRAAVELRRRATGNRRADPVPVLRARLRPVSSSASGPKGSDTCSRSGSGTSPASSTR